MVVWCGAVQWVPGKMVRGGSFCGACCLSAGCLQHAFRRSSPTSPSPARPPSRCVCRRRLLPLLRFASSKSPDKEITLDEYVGRMKVGQKHIYYLVGEWVRVPAASASSEC